MSTVDSTMKELPTWTLKLTQCVTEFKADTQEVEATVVFALEGMFAQTTNLSVQVTSIPDSNSDKIVGIACKRLSNWFDLIGRSFDNCSLPNQTQVSDEPKPVRFDRVILLQGNQCLAVFNLAGGLLVDNDLNMSINIGRRDHYAVTIPLDAKEEKDKSFYDIFILSRKKMRDRINHAQRRLTSEPPLEGDNTSRFPITL